MLHHYSERTTRRTKNFTPNLFFFHLIREILHETSKFLHQIRNVLHQTLGFRSILSDVIAENTIANKKYSISMDQILKSE